MSGIYVDDVYHGLLLGSELDLTDLDRVEVLRGPQGTLAGKNSIGGSIKLFSKKPSEETDGYVEATYGEFNLIKIRAGGNFTLVPDTLYARVSGVSETQDGYMKRLDYACVTGQTSARRRFRCTDASSARKAARICTRCAWRCAGSSSDKHREQLHRQRHARTAPRCRR